MTNLPPWQQQIHAARLAAGQANWSAYNHVLNALLRQWGNHPAALLDAGALLLDAGQLSRCERLMHWCHQLAPHSHLPLFNLANVWLQTLRQSEAIGLYRQLNQSSNLLMSMGYLPGPPAAAARQSAEAWASALHGDEVSLPSPPAPPIGVLRLGFLSADLCQHPVGLFLWPLVEELAAIPGVDLCFYDNRPRCDWLTERLQLCGRWREVSGLDDAKLAARIRADELSVLLELSGHTARNRLPVLLRRPAPLQLSWLGYWGPTGLGSVLDGVVVDEWVVPPGSAEERSFDEPLLRLPSGRWCYRPVPWMPEVTDPPCLERGWIMFGSFNSSSKLNEQLLCCWAGVLREVPNSRLLLKNYQLSDSGLQRQLRQFMVEQGVAADRLELEGPSVHAELLAAYSRVDIALDPFPFNGGLTSCEALWLGLPLVTLSSENHVGVMAARQGVSLLSQIGRTEWIASNPEHYIRIARNLARCPQSLQQIRRFQRSQIQTSSLCDSSGFATGFLNTIRTLLEARLTLK